MPTTTQELFDEVRNLTENDRAIPAKIRDKLLFAAIADLRVSVTGIQKKVDKMFVLYQVLTWVGGLMIALVSGIGAKVFINKP